MIVLFQCTIPQCHLQTDAGNTQFVLYRFSLYLIEILSNKILITDIVQDKTLVRIVMIEFKNQHFSVQRHFF